MNSCNVEECDKAPYGRGMCTTHYYRWLRHGNVNTVQDKHESAVGKNFGRWTALKRVAGSVPIHYQCECECGTKKSVPYGSLRDGSSQSCGCRRAKLTPGVGAMNHLLASYRGGAKRRGLEFTLTVQQFQTLTSSGCFYCGQEPASEKIAPHSKGSYFYNGIDRVDNNQGYIMGNVVPCCGVCNKAKQQMTTEEFAAWAQRLCVGLRASGLWLDGQSA